MPLVSVIVPIFGVEKHIEKCARSLFSQTLEDIEFIFVNDGTKDSSMEVLNRVISEYSERNVILLEHDRNRGLPEARKTGLARATGEYIIHCDSDDWVDPLYCQVLYETAVRTGSDMVVCGYWMSDGESYWEDTRYLDELYVDGAKYFTSSLALISSPFVWNKMVKRDIYKQNLVYPCSYLAEDWVMSVQYAYYSKKTAVIEDKLYYYYENPDSQRLSVDKMSCINKCTSEAANVELIINWLKEHDLYSQKRVEVVKRASNAKKQLLNVLDDSECRAMWLKTFKQYNFQILFNKYIKTDYKLLHSSLMLHLYCPIKRLRVVLRKRL